MNRPEHQVPGFRRVHGGFERFTVSHFTHQHDIGVFTHRMLHGGMEVTDVLAQFSLVDQALIGLVNEFDRVFNRKNVLLMITVDPVEHRGDRGRLTRTGHTGEQHHSLIVDAQVFENGWQEQSLKVWNASFDLTSHHSHFAHLDEQVHAVPPRFAFVFHNVSKVRPPGIFEDLLITLVHEGPAEIAHFVFVDRRHVERVQ